MTPEADELFDKLWGAIANRDVSTCDLADALFQIMGWAAARMHPQDQAEFLETLIPRLRRSIAANERDQAKLEAATVAMGALMGRCLPKKPTAAPIIRVNGGRGLAGL